MGSALAFSISKHIMTYADDFLASEPPMILADRDPETGSTPANGNDPDGDSAQETGEAPTNAPTDGTAPDTCNKSSTYPDYDCIMVLGASVHSDGTPSQMLRDRLDKGIELYKKGVAPKLLMTGDNGHIEYNEVEAMKQYAIEAGIPEKDIFLDHAGFSTYESMFRARDVFNVKSMVIVTQKYHEYRAIYIAKKLGLEVDGVYCKDVRYGGQLARDFREVLARDKDFVKCIFKPDPTFLGDVIDIKGDGRKSWSD